MTEPEEVLCGQKSRMLCCDPPYGIDYAAKNEFLNRTDRGNRMQRPIANDELGPQAVAALFRDARRQRLRHRRHYFEQLSDHFGCCADYIWRRLRCFRE